VRGGLVKVEITLSKDDGTTKVDAILLTGPGVTCLKAPKNFIGFLYCLDAAMESQGLPNVFREEHVPSKREPKIERLPCPKCRMNMIVVQGFYSQSPKFECLRRGHIEQQSAHGDPSAE
jgi:hypothetical protein